MSKTNVSPGIDRVLKTAEGLTPDWFPIVNVGTILYLIFPSFFFAIGWLKWPFNIINILILSIFTVYLFSDIYQNYGKVKTGKLFQANRDIYAKSLIFAGLVLFSLIAWLLFSGIGGFGQQQANYAMFKELIFQNWPIGLTINGVHERVVYYFAYYLPAAAVGKIFGWDFANIFLFVWTLFGVVLSFLWFLQITKVNINQSYGRFFILLVIFCLAGGLDFFGSKFLQNVAVSGTIINEWWAGYFQYSSNTTLLYWVPQHVVAAWLLTGLICNALFDLRNIKYLGMAISSGIIWTPFGLVGTVPFLLLVVFFCLLPANRSYILNRPSILLNMLSVWIGAMHLLYIGSNQFKFPIGFVWQTVHDHGHLLKYLLAFWFLEFALLGGLVILLLLLGFRSSNKKNDPILETSSGWDNLKNRLADEYGILPAQIYQFLLCLAVLFCLPLFMLGINNDFVMRASIPSLFIFWTFVGKAIIDASVRVRARQNLLYVTLYSSILAIVVIGFYPAMRGIKSSVNAYHFGPTDLSSVPAFVDANSPEYVLQKIGNIQSYFYRYVGK